MLYRGRRGGENLKNEGMGPKKKGPKRELRDMRRETLIEEGCIYFPFSLRSQIMKQT